MKTIHFKRSPSGEYVSEESLESAKKRLEDIAFGEDIKVRFLVLAVASFAFAGFITADILIDGFSSAKVWFLLVFLFFTGSSVKTFIEENNTN